MTTRFRIKFSPVNRVFLGVLGLAPWWSHVDVDTDADEVRVQMSYGFSGTIPRSSITGATVLPRAPLGWGVGVHGWGGWWVVNGTLRQVVCVDIEPRAKARVLGVPVKLKKLCVSLEDPDGFLRAIGH